MSAPLMARSRVSSAPPAVSAPAGDHVQSRSIAANLLSSVRPHQWTKNLIVFAGLIFSEQHLLLDGSAVFVESCREAMGRVRFNGCC